MLEQARTHYRRMLTMEIVKCRVAWKRKAELGGRSSNHATISGGEEASVIMSKLHEVLDL